MKLPEQIENSSSGETPSFEQALAALEQIVHDLEEGRLGVAESLARYEEGVKLLKQCHGLLERAERRIELLTGVDESGNALTEPFDDRATFSGTEAEQPKRPRRSGKTPKRAREADSAPDIDEESTANRESSTSAMDEPGSLF
jgi:exodeoxyribonuclease VII small subunit